MASQDPTYPLFPIFSFLAFIICLIPLPWHIHAWNSGTCSYILWTATTCLVLFINSIVWSGNLDNPAPVWCDISSKLILGVSVGIPASVLCITRRLYNLTSCRTVSITIEDKRRMIISDLCISIGIPVIIMTLHYVVQGHRFDILENIGCFPVVYNTLPAYFLYFMWPPLLGLISFVFSALTLRSFWIRRVQFSQLISSNSSMTISRYIRLVSFSIIDMMCTVPISIYSIYLGDKGVGLAPWISWENTHFNFSKVDLIPSLIWRSDPSFRQSVELTRWLPVVCAILFFILFGFASEAQRHYQLAFWAVMKLFGIHPHPAISTKKLLPQWAKPFQITKSPSISSLPLYDSKSPMTKKRDLQSSSISTSTHHDVSYELGSYPTLDHEKTGGHSPVTSESSTMHYSPPSYFLRPQPEHVPTDVNVVEAEHDKGLDSPPSSFAKPKTSSSSLRSILDRLQVSPSPSSDSLRCPATLSSPAASDNVIQVMVCTTETRSAEVLVT